jgi:peptidoglycan/LPS O-acetylase OafA/YrhL
MADYSQLRYFNGLNALRFFAAYLVVLHHAEQIRMKYELFHLKEFSLFNNGSVAVTFFFSLSGFLISYLLLRESESTGTVAVRKFYMRRILRIWPLYYLLVLVGALLLPAFLNFIQHSYEMPYQFGDVIAYFVLFAPFMVNIRFGHHLLEPLWSIGVEEVFYIFWAPLWKLFRKNILWIIAGIFVARILLMAGAALYEWPDTVEQLIAMLQFEAMAMGGLAAYWLYHRKSPVEKALIFSRPFQWVALSFIAAQLGAVRFLSSAWVGFEWLFQTPVISSSLMIMAFTWLIVNMAVNTNSVLKLNHTVFESLGDSSYGIYMYHMLVIFAVILFFGEFLAALSPVLSTLVFYFLITAGTLVVAHLSRHYFENRFLKLKTRFRD